MPNKKQITAYSRNILRNEKYYTLATLSGLQDQITTLSGLASGSTANDINVDGAGGTPIPGENFYYYGPVSTALSKNGGNTSLPLAGGQTLNHLAHPSITIIDTDGYLAEKTVPADALKSNLETYNALPRRLAIPNNNNSYGGDYTIVESGMFGYRVFVAGGDVLVLGGGAVEPYINPIQNPSEAYTWQFVGLFYGADDGVTINLYNEFNDLMDTADVYMNDATLTQVSAVFDVSAYLPTRFRVEITPFSNLYIHGMAMYPVYTTDLGDETIFSPSPNLFDSIVGTDIVEGSITGDKIADDTISTTHLQTSITNRMFTASGYRNVVEQVVPNGGTPYINTDMVYEFSIRDAAVTRAKESFVDGSVLGNMLPERWGLQHEAPYTINTISGVGGNWLSYTGEVDLLGRRGYGFSLNNTPTVSGQTRIYFGTSPTDYNITLYPRSSFNSTNFAYDETQYLNITAKCLANNTIFSKKPVFGIRLANGTDLTMAGYAKVMTSTITDVYEYAEVSGITSITSGILYLDQPTRSTVARTFTLADLQVFYSSKTPSTYFQDGSNSYTPNLKQAVTQDYIHPTFSLCPIGSILDYAGSTAPTGWLIASGQALTVSAYSGLYNVLGYTYGGSAGTFYLPDLRGRVIAQASASHTFATTSGLDTTSFNSAELEYTAGGSSVIYLDGNTITYNNIQPTYYLNKIIYTGQ